jgi:RHS repeat-associated protein
MIAGDTPILQQNPGTWYYHINDHLGTCRVVIDHLGQVIRAQDYFPFGLTLRSLNNQKTRFSYTGKELDTAGALGWFYFGARYYDPGIGRFISVDPLEEEYWGWSPYLYCRNRPTTQIDLDGNKDYNFNQITKRFNNWVNDVNDFFFNTKIKISRTAMDQTGQEFVAKNLEHFNKSTDELLPSEEEVVTVLDVTADISGKMAAGLYTTSLLTAWAPPVSTGFAFTGSTAETISTVSSGLKYALTGDNNDASSAVISTIGMGSGGIISSRLLKTTKTDKFQNYSESKIIESGVQAVIQALGISIDENLEQEEIKKNE